MTTDVLVLGAHNKMKFLDEYRDGDKARQYSRAIAQITTGSWTIMEVCGGQTHTILKYGIDQLLPKEITLLHGPGCPVCVTPLEMIDQALAIASMESVTFCTFGDMLRVPGSEKDLLTVKSEGADVRMVYSPMDALKIARENPDRQVVFFAVGFETTAPANAMAVFQAQQEYRENFSILCSQVLVPPAMDAIMSTPGVMVQGFLAAGHVCTVMGYEQYKPLAKKYKVPIVVTGFEPLDIVQGIYMCIKQLEEGRCEVQNQYSRSVSREGNLPAQKLLREVFQIVPRKWRGLGEIPHSGLALRDRYAGLDAATRFNVGHISSAESSDCISGAVLQGRKKPQDCPAFGARCTPAQPLGATMVSSEGACAAYYQYRQWQDHLPATA